jgi:HEPN domain-containing protein
MNTDLANGFLERASNKLNDSRMLCERIRFAEAVSAAQESIELSAKAVFLLLGPAHPRKHDFSEEEFLAVLEEVPEGLKFHNFPRLYLLHRFWAGFYTTAKYGLEVIGSPAKDLFQLPEAELATSHATSWYIAATSVRSNVQTRGLA